MSGSWGKIPNSTDSNDRNDRYDPYTKKLLRLFQHNEKRLSVSEVQYDKLCQHLDQHSKFLALHHLVGDPVLGSRIEDLLGHAAKNPKYWSYNHPERELSRAIRSLRESRVEEALDPQEDRFGDRHDKAPSRLAQAFAVDHQKLPEWALAAGYGPPSGAGTTDYGAEATAYYEGSLRKRLSRREPFTASANLLLRRTLDRIAKKNGYTPHPMGPDDLSHDEEASATGSHKYTLDELPLYRRPRLRLPEAASYRRPRELPEQVHEGHLSDQTLSLWLNSRNTSEHYPNRSISSLRNSLLGKSER